MTSSSVAVLIIEDDAPQAALLGEFLRLLGPPGIVVRTAARLADGLALLEQHPIDVVVTDLSLPDSVGTRTVTAILDGAPEACVVVMSGRGEGGVAAESVAAGARDFLLKGHVNYEDVVARILAAAGPAAGAELESE